VAIDTFSPNRNYTLPATGNDVNSWGPLINANFSAIDSNISAAFPITTTGGTTTLTAANAANLFYNVTGALTSNAIVVFPFTGTFFLASNNTTGAFTLTFSATGAGNSAVLPQGESGVFYSDGTNISLISNTSPAVIPSGTILAGFLQATAPVGWTQNNTFNDQVIRLVNNTGTGGATGGSWTINGFSDTPVSLALAQLPAVTINLPGTILNGNGQNTSNLSVPSGNGPYFTGNTAQLGGGGATHNHSPITNDGTWRPAFANALVCTKN
jgi:hypothetical protein